MLSVPVDDLLLSKRDKACCRRADLGNAAQILNSSYNENPIIGQLFGSSQFEHVQEVAAYAQAPRSFSVLDILEDADIRNWKRKDSKVPTSDSEEIAISEKAAGKRKSSPHLDVISSQPPSRCFSLSTGDVEMDALLGGGIRRGCLTEIVGESSSGKSQFGMQTAVFTALALLPLEERDQGEWSSSQLKDDNLYDALRGYGIRPKSNIGGVAILNSGGHAIGHMMIRRMIELTYSLIEERWNIASTQGSTTKRPRKSRSEHSWGVFQEDGNKKSSLEETQVMAKQRLLENIHLASPTDCESLEHALSYTLPALADRLHCKGKAQISLIIIDDLPELLIDEGEALNQKDYTLKRSRILCEITNCLKRFNSLSNYSLPSNAMAFLIMNQVVGTFATLLPLLDEQAWTDRPWYTSGPPPLSSVYQEGYYNGILASADIQIIKEVRARRLINVDNEEDIKIVSNSTKMAALGHSWVNCINVRIMLTRTKQFIICKDQVKFNVRRAVSILNPFAKAGHGWDPHVNYVVQKSGIKAISRLKSQDDELNYPDEDKLWSSFDVNFKPDDMNSIIDQQEKSSRRDQEDDELWAALSPSSIDEEQLAMTINV